MTTSNQVITHVMDSVLFIPLESVHANDSLTYVFTRSGDKQVVVLGESNENHIVVEMGLNRGDLLYLSMPENLESFKYAGLELMEEILRRKAEVEQRRLDQQKKMNEPQQPQDFRGAPPGRPSGGDANRTRG